MAISCSAIFAVLVLFLSPLYIQINADATLRDTPLSDLVYLLLQLLEILAFSVASSIIIHSAVTQTAKKAWGLFGIYCAVTVLRRTVTLLISFISFGYIDDLEFFSTAVYTILDAAQISIITAIVTRIARSHLTQAAIKQKAAARLGNSLKSDIDFSKIYSRRNPYARCSVAAAAVICATKILNRVFFDVFAGMPEGWLEIASMVIGYLSDALIFAVAYAICWLLCSYLYKKARE